ncbi:N-6 DNA methylase [Cloacibacillus sp. An23]|uniref:N-6 DNA methylase n=1 Tax=Cloacibacillus sp. An23 TaxID=1965591 RepID=UPI001EF74421|nr:N-6 DNA methylase [Cloacibacillus sp. An23]
MKPLLKKNLYDFTPEDKIVNKFEEILRHNNVSDKENAFNRLVALFICKLVDESTKEEDDEVEFQYKQGTDTYETLQDRLQRLHRDGMEKFMREKIYYVSADYPEQLFANYTDSKRKNAIENLKETIRILKFYSNNEFAFKDVHNEELFYQNGKILVEMVQLFEKYRIVYPSRHQFLGDLFEQLLNKGFKQNEGQFFTPVPVTRFIWDSLPVARMVKSERGTVYPKVIDYACGAGHFLTEAVEAINYFVKSDGNNAWARDHIYGIEKDYRLARVAKISLFMNGAGEGNIIFGDGLENVPDKGIENGAFDILVANPPYSVKDFKQHLQLKNNSFELLDRIGLNGGEIETLFVERIGQLLKPRGVAAVILPSSILSNDSASYTGAREQLLKNFYIRAIVSLGSKTFGATGTNTVIMFLEKFNEPPKTADLTEDSVEAIFSGASLNGWTDKEILEAYAAQIEVDEDIYNAFLAKKYSLTELEETAYFKMYASAFAGSSDAKKLKDKKVYKKMNVEEQKAAYLEAFYNYANEIERKKVFYFSLVFRQTTVIITAPSDNNAQREFLGYDWSNRKGNEGIQIIAPGGKMYGDADREAENTLAHAVRQSFDGAAPSFSEEHQAYGAVVDTKDMLDFSRPSFNKTLKLSAARKQQISIRSKYPLKKLGEIAPYVMDRGNLDDIDITSFITTDNMIRNRGGVVDYKGIPNIQTVVRYQRDDILVSNIRPYLKKIWYADIDGGCSPDVLVFRVTNQNLILPKYLFAVLSLDVFFDFMMADHKGTKMPRGNKTLIPQFNVPVPPISVQQQIIEECEKIDEEYNTTRMSIETYRHKIEELFNELDIANGGGAKLSLSDIEKFDISIGKRVVSTQLVENGLIPVYSANVTEPFGYINELLITDFSVPSVLWGIDGDWMTAYMPENIEFYPTDHCGVLRCKTPQVNPRYMAHVLEREGQKIGFSRSLRASIDRVQGITFTVPDRKAQDETVAKVNELEEKIKEAESILDTLNDSISDILNRYLI